MTSEQAILTAARKLFAENSYKTVTVRAIATAAGYSPALVIKTMGSKEKLFSRVALDPGEIEGSSADESRETLGRRLVQRVFDRRRLGISDPWALAPRLVESAPEPDLLRDRFGERYEMSMAAVIGDASKDRLNTKLVISLLLGIGAAAHSLKFFTGTEDEEAAIEQFGAMLQVPIDRCEGDLASLPPATVSTLDPDNTPRDSLPK